MDEEEETPITGITIIESDGEYFVLLEDVANGLRQIALTHAEAAGEYVEIGERDLALAHGLFARQLNAEADEYMAAVMDWSNFGQDAEPEVASG